MTLTPEVATLGLSVGLMLALVCYLVTNLSPGGLVTPGWLAVAVVEDARRLLVIAAVAVVAYVGTRLLQRHVILYGKRLFVVVVLLGVLLQVSVFLFMLDRFPYFAHETLGFIVPGLVAHQLLRQPVKETVIATTAVTILASGVLVSGVLLRLIPAA